MQNQFKRIVEIYEERNILNEEAKLLFLDIKKEDPNFNVSIAKRVIKDYLIGNSVELLDEEVETYKKYQELL